jgi:hypothetical protein
MGGWRRWLLVALVALLALAGTTYGGLVAATARSQLARQTVMTVDRHAPQQPLPPASGRRRSDQVHGRQP